MILVLISWFAIALGIATALAIAGDCCKRPQRMGIMNLTWPITGLYSPLVGWWLYQSMGRASPPRAGGKTGHQAQQHAAKPKWQSVFVGATHCGDGCVLGDSIAAPIAAATGFAVAGSVLFGHFVAEFIGAYLFGILFQFLPALSMGKSSPGKALINAIKADTLSLIAFEVGMFGWMALVALVLLPSAHDPGSAVFWFMMQIGMILGFATTYPANWWLISRGIKHGM